MQKILNLLRISWVLPLSLLATACSFVLMLLVQPISSNSQIQSQQLISDAVCLGWNEQFSPTTQKVFTINGSETRLASTSIGNQLIELQPRAVFTVENFKSSKLRIITQGNAANSINEFHLVRESGKGKAGAAIETCRPPGPEWWFSGINTTAGFGSQLVIGNPDNTEVVVALRAFTIDGEFALAENRRLVIPGDSVRIVDLTRTIPAQKSAALQVSAVDGRIVANVQVDAIQGVKTRGRSFIQAVNGPTSRQYFASLPVDGIDAVVHLLSAEEDAAVSVFAHTKDGSFLVSGGENIFLAEGRIQTVNLDRLGNRDVAMISIESDVPVIAAMSFLALNSRGGDWEVVTPIEEFGSQSSIVIPDGASSATLQLYSDSSDFVTVRKIYQKRVVWESRIELEAETLKSISIPKGSALSGQLVISSPSAKTVASATYRFGSRAGLTHTVLGFSNPLSEISPAFRLRLVVP